MSFEPENALSVPAGWLVQPEKKRLLFFIKDSKSLANKPKVITQLWLTSPDGDLTRIKNTRTMRLEDAVETWNELIGNGWKFAEQPIHK
tara:strand:- start:73 stop:339 length:267 start_codon:yes stop_codon:yes gene_type:complete